MDICTSGAELYFMYSKAASGGIVRKFHQAPCYNEFQVVNTGFEEMAHRHLIQA